MDTYIDTTILIVIPLHILQFIIGEEIGIVERLKSFYDLRWS